MPQMDTPEKKAPEERRFIRENIVRRPMSKRQIAKRLIVLFLVALMFGVVAAVSFVVALPWAGRYLGEETTVESSTISIPKDEPETVITETEPPATPEETEPIEDVLQSVMEQYQYSVGDLNSMFSQYYGVVSEADKGIVTIHSVKHNLDWFDNPVETAGQYAGAVVADTEQELLILTPEEAVENADSIKVTLANGTIVDGWLKQRDYVSGMAVVSVDTGNLSERDLNGVKTLELGNSIAVKQGDMVAAVGSPVGIVHSMDYGFISFIRRNVPVTDGVSRVLYTTSRGNAEKGTFLINLNGELIGWVTDQFVSDQSGDAAIVMGISDYKGILEKMTNGRSIPYMGIMGQVVNEEIAGTGTPSGIYVTDSLVDGPAYNAGIQNGDIMTAIGDSSVTTLKDFQNQLESLNEGDVVTVTVQRYGRDFYTELKYQVTIGAR